MDMGPVQAAADANFVASLTRLVAHVPGAATREFRGVTAVVTGLPVGLFNGCFALEDAPPDALDDAIHWVEDASVPFRVWIREELGDKLAAVPLRHGLMRLERLYPGMALDPARRSRRRRRVSTSTGSSTRRTWRTTGRSWSRAAPRRTWWPASSRRRFSRTHDFGLFAAALDARPAGTALTVRTGTTVGVYNVNTLAWARRRGVGTAVTGAAIADGRAAGCESAVLQSSEMGQPMYEAMGFRTVVRYLEFVRPRS